MNISLERMADNAAHAEYFLKQLANRNRLIILCVLNEGELSVTELNTRVPVSQSALSQHLARLREAGMVATRRESQTVYYRLDDPDVSLVIGCLYQKYCQ
jgi:DNA-binding transcriptional ArsR family regulator